MATKITPSILNCDFAHLGDEIARIPSADEIHVDVMDNHFVPNLSLGIPVVESIRKSTDKPLDVHLMIEDPDQWAPAYAELGAESVTFHMEAAHAPIRLARELHTMGTKVGVGLNPATPISVVTTMIDEVDRVLMMTVEPGFGGQKFLDLVLPKIRELRALVQPTGKELIIQVDGGVSLETIGRCAEAGADMFVAGSAVFRADDPDAMVAALREAARSATADTPGA